MGAQEHEHASNQKSLAPDIGGADDDSLLNLDCEGCYHAGSDEDHHRVADLIGDQKGRVL